MSDIEPPDQGTRRQAVPAEVPQATGAGSLARHHSKRDRRRRRVAWVVAIVLAIVAICAAALEASRSTSTHTGTSVPLATGVVTSPATTERISYSMHTLLRLGAASSASAAASGDSAAFATDGRRETLVRFNPTTGQVERTVSLQGRPASMVLTGRHLWVSEPAENEVVELNATTLQDVRSVAVPSGPTNLAVLGGQLWVTSQDRLSVTPLALGTGVVGTRVDVLSGAVDVVGGFGALWVTGTANRLTRITPPSSSGVAPAQRVIVVGQQPLGVATGAGSVWVANSQSGTVSQVDPTTLTVTRTRTVGANPRSIAVANDGPVYVGLGSAKALTVLTLSASTTLHLSTHPQDLLTVGAGVWVAGSDPGRVLSVSQ